MHVHVLRFLPRLAIVTLLFCAFASLASAEESVIVPADLGTLSVLDLATLTTTQVINAAGYQGFAAIGANHRLAFIGAQNYISVVDFTIGREVKRIYGVCASQSFAFTSDQKYLLVENTCGNTLDLIDTAALHLVRRINLMRALGSYGLYWQMGSIVVVGRKAYVTMIVPDQNRPAAAMVDLKTFAVKPIRVPSGYFEGGPWTPNAVAMPDGKYVVLLETLNSDQNAHLLFVSTTSDAIVMDYVVYYADGLLITPVNQSGKVYGYVSTTGLGVSIAAVDLNYGSPTFGQLLPQTQVAIQGLFRYPEAEAINADGTRLVIGGHRLGQGSPIPNLVEIDTGKMFTDPTHAVIGQATVAGGVSPHGLAIATITTASPPTAPSVTGVSPDSITNNVSNTIQVTGTNFAAGATVRIGTQPPLPATVLSPANLQVTMPKDAPAQPSLDVIVTNPNASGSPSQQYQSGLLASAFTIEPNPTFQPKQQFAALDLGDYSVSIYEPGPRSMVNVPNHTAVPYGIAFNLDGLGVYGNGKGDPGLFVPLQLTEWNAATGLVEAQVPIIQGTYGGFPGLEISLAASRNPNTGGPAMFVPIYQDSNLYVALSMVDTNSSSPTFNQVIQTLTSGIRSFGLGGAVATPDGKYVYVNGYDNYDDQFASYIHVFDIAHGTVTTHTTGSLGVAGKQTEMIVSPDGQSLLLSGSGATYGSIVVLDIGNDPKNPAPVTSIRGMAPAHVGGGGDLTPVSWKVVGDHLFTLDSIKSVVAVFNFDRVHSNFTQIAAYALPVQAHSSNIAVSPDGLLIYVPLPDYDSIAVLDANLLVSGQDPLITNIGAFRAPVQLTVSPVSQLSRALRDDR
jgi:hypothetical protein